MIIKIKLKIVAVIKKNEVQKMQSNCDNRNPGKEMQCNDGSQVGMHVLVQISGEVAVTGLSVFAACN